jgi:hypothetical protein
MPENCDECGSSVSHYANVPVREGRALCGECFIKASVNPEAQLARCGGLCERCGASLDKGPTVFSEKDGVLCFECHRKDQLANWEKLPGAPEACGQCGKSFAGSDVAMSWEEKALCLDCFNQVRKAHPEITQFKLIPLVNLGWAGKDFENQPNLVLDTLGPDLEKWSDQSPERREEYIN